ncbi:N-lysine methyltransferase KMT5A-like [Dreissena polymorpha]|uniref:N-lysine methyltransferase KMT5A-like n=1 Tax=Dreissena polymorpha TaxID=45954 RepID=UPI0022653227|nr:N-lysine methyltransferase KMT5A-like [Dreissena polymorpha]
MSVKSVERRFRTEVHRNKGDFLLTYHGELITGEEGNKRELIIDSTLEVKSGQFLGRLVNHGKGKEQNCKMKCIEVNKKPYLCLFAQRDIQTGEELLYDYGVSDLPWKVSYIIYIIFNK